jgi:two-component system, NarL family, response regulator
MSAMQKCTGIRSRVGRRGAIAAAMDWSEPRIQQLLKDSGGVNGRMERQETPLLQDSSMRSDDTESDGTPFRPQKVLTVLIADDHPCVREGLAAIINRRPDMRVVAEASSGFEAVEAFLTHHPDVALLDLRMPGMDGVEAVSAICRKDAGARLAILTTYHSEEDIYRALRAGAQGYVLKGAPAEELVGCIRAVGENRTWIPPDVGAQLAKRVSVPELTRREIEVLQILATGKSNKEIAAALDITESTVKVHVTHVLEKLSASGRTEAISVAMKRGLVSADWASTG